MDHLSWKDVYRLGALVWGLFVKDFSGSQTLQKANGVRYAIHPPFRVPWETSPFPCLGLAGDLQRAMVNMTHEK